MNTAEVTAYHGSNWVRFEATEDQILYEAWAYEDGRPNRYAVDCEPVSALPNTRAANDVTAAAIRAMTILAAH